MKLPLRWMCSDYSRHSHRYKWAAWLCGHAQWKLSRVLSWLLLHGFMTTKEGDVYRWRDFTVAPIRRLFR